jgi:hypothetical protein
VVGQALHDRHPQAVIADRRLLSAWADHGERAAGRVDAASRRVEAKVEAGVLQVRTGAVRQVAPVRHVAGTWYGMPQIE